MRRLTINIVALAVMLSLASVLFVATFNSSHAHGAYGAHDTMTGMKNCPFMVHEDTLCPMSAFDHLSMLRGIFETIVSGIATFTLLVSVALLPFLYTATAKMSLGLFIHTFYRWRKYAIYRFASRPLQDFFARGILHPKLFPASA